MFKLICYETCYDSQSVIESILTNRLELFYIKCIYIWYNVPSSLLDQLPKKNVKIQQNKIFL